MSGIGLAILLVVAVPVLVFAIWQVLNDARVRVEAGTVGLLVVRGVARPQALEPGVHYIWPYRQQLIQVYPIRSLVYLTMDGEQPAPADYTDPPLPLHLGDRTAARASYTVRFRIRPDGVKTVHDRIGPDGLHALVRDRSRHAIVDVLGDPDVGYDGAFGVAREELGSRLATQLGEVLEADGLEVELFTLRSIDLGTVGQTVQEAVRWRAELDREAAAAAVRAARVRNEAQLNAELAGALDEDVLRYRLIEVWRELIARWDGTGLPPPIGGTTDAQAQAAAVTEEPQ